MPFTFAHPAIVLPFFKIQTKKICASALIIGSMSPDFEYFLKMQLTDRYSHTLLGAILQDLPIAISVYFIFHLIIKQALIQNSPAYFKARLQPLKDFNALIYAKQYPMGLMMCLLIGIASHIVWDSFTHARGDLVSLYPFLSIPSNSNWPVFLYLQHGSTMIGFLIIGIYFHHIPKSTINTEQVQNKFWVMVAVVALLIFVIRSLFGFEYYAVVIVSLVSSVLFGVVAISVTFKLRYRKR